MTAYLSVAEFRTESLMPGSQVDALENEHPGFLAAKLARRSAAIDSRLRKRYAAPFAAPYPDKVIEWLLAGVTLAAYLKLGVDPLDAQIADIKEAAQTADEELKEAADSNTGLFDLPLRADTTDDGISKGGTLGYSEQSPYVWKDVQVDAARGDDERRRGR